MASHQGEASSSMDAQSAYNDLKRLIPSLAAELELLRTSLREHSLWLLRYGHGGASIPNPTATQGRGDASSAARAPSVPSEGATASTDIHQSGVASSSESTREASQAEPPHANAPSTTATTTTPSTASSQAPPPPSLSSPSPNDPPPAFSESDPPAYSASDVPPYTGGFSTVSASTCEEVQARRDQLTEWLREGEDVLREYSARYAQLAAELRLPQEDLLGTWHEAHPDNALPGYQQIERNEELMVGGVGEVPPPYLGGRPQGLGGGSRGGLDGAPLGTGEGSSSSGKGPAGDV